jgi:hypothetical protein
MTSIDVSTAPPPPRAAATAAPVAVPASRDPRLDFYRGIAMIIILFAHTPGNFFTLWIPARWGFSDATEIFVFCSGMASAIAFARSYDRAGWARGTARVAYRVWQVYWAHVGLFFAVAAMMAALDATGAFERDYVGQLNLYPFFREPAQQLPGLLTLTYVPNYFDILPMYMVILCMMPVLMALGRAHVGLVFAAVGLTWLLAQEALLAALGLGALHLDLPAEPWSERTWFFDPFGWQLVFFTGFALMRGWIPAPPVATWLVALAAAIVLLSVPVSNIGVRVLGLGWAEDWRAANAALFDKSHFGVLRYVHFLALAYLAWVAAGAGGRRLVADEGTPAGRLWGAAVRVLMKVGQQSLAVFVFSMALARLSGFALDQIGRGLVTTTLVNLAGVALLVSVAYGVGWFKSEPWRGRPAADGGRA